MQKNENMAFLDDDLEKKLAEFEAAQRAKLGIPADNKDQWFDANPQTFTRAQRETTTILHGGLTYAQDIFAQSAMNGLGYHFEAMEVPTNDALQYGREYGNRGQCNPTYFTVGNLIKHLTYLRDEKKIPTEDIVKNYMFLTAGACGPCRFGTYVTEYRKALRDSGFGGFRVMLFQQTGGLKQATGEGVGLELNASFFKGLLQSLIIGDVLNALMYRIRPYEVIAGSTDKAIKECREIICDAFENRKSILKALWKTRRIMGKIKVDRTVIKPKVAVIGEFWAMTTEGDGNYKLQSFLESEGAEVEVQLVTAWILYMLWQARYDTKERADLRGTDSGRFGLEGVDVRKKLIMLEAAEYAMRGFFKSVSAILGLRDYHLPDMNHMAEVSHAFYDNNLRGGEGHMEVGKLILNIAKSKVNMTLSVKPFGCMPSSSVSDGVQSLITEMFPEGLFLPIETNGDGAVNVYSRVQMQLFKARQHAAREVERELKKANLSMEDFKAYLKKHPEMMSSFHKAPHVAGCTTADLVAEVAANQSFSKRMLRKATKLWNSKKDEQANLHWLRSVAKTAAAKAKAKGAIVKPEEKGDAFIGEDATGSANKTQLRVLN